MALGPSCQVLLMCSKMCPLFSNFQFSLNLITLSTHHTIQYNYLSLYLCIMLNEIFQFVVTHLCVSILLDMFMTGLTHRLHTKPIIIFSIYLHPLYNSGLDLNSVLYSLNKCFCMIMQFSL